MMYSWTFFYCCFSNISLVRWTKEEEEAWMSELVYSVLDGYMLFEREGKVKFNFTICVGLYLRLIILQTVERHFPRYSSKIKTVLCVLYSVSCILCSVFYTVFCILCPVFCVQYFILCSAFCVLYLLFSIL